MAEDCCDFFISLFHWSVCSLFKKKGGNCKTVSAKSFSLLPCKKISFPFEYVDKHADQIEMQETRSCAVAK